MKLERLERLDPWTWRVRREPAGAARADAILYGDDGLLQSMDDKVLEQIGNVARLPGLVGSAFAMPDAHWGYGFPIGGVAAFDPARGGIVSAGGVGFDISCGIRCLRTDVPVDAVVPVAAKLADSLFRDVPAGVGVEGELELAPAALDQVLRDGAQWAVRQGFGEAADLEYIEERGRIGGAEPANVSPLAKRRQRGEMGTLGSGNHYLEVQAVDRIFDVAAAEAYGLRANQVLISIHCGSRGLGHQIGSEFLVSLAKAAARLGVDLPDRELACPPIESPEGQQYLGAMNAAINCALANRQILSHLARRTFRHFFPQAGVETLYDVSHNTCKAEQHDVGGKRRLLYVHRKGATRAFGPGHPEVPARYRACGQPVIIGGSMGTGSYVLAGLASSDARVEFGQPRRRPRDEPSPGAAPLAGAGAGRSAARAGNLRAHAFHARRRRRSAGRLQGRRRGRCRDRGRGSGTPRRLPATAGVHQGLIRRTPGAASMAVHNVDIAGVFDQIADLLEIGGENPFRIRAYRSAARTVERYPRDLKGLIDSGEVLPKLPGVGDDLAAKIAEICATGTCDVLTRLHGSLPPGIGRLLSLPALGPKRVQQLHAALQVDTIEDLDRAVHDGRLAAVPGFGEKTVQRIREAIDARRGVVPRYSLPLARQYALPIVARLQKVAGVRDVTTAGSLRRQRETVGDVDLIAAADQGAPVTAALCADEDVTQVLAHGDTRATVILRGGLQLDLRVVPPPSRGAALQYFTGSKAHNIALRKRAQTRGLKLNEYGVFRGGRRIAGATEESVYRAVGLDWIAPELREDRGEIDAASMHRLPRLIERTDLTGDLHVHTKASDGRANIAQMAAAARQADLSYIAITDHSQRLTVAHGLDARRLVRQMDEIDRLNAQVDGITVLKGIEVDILLDGRLDLPDSVLSRLDLVIGAIHMGYELTRSKQTRRLQRAIANRHFTILAHPGGRLIGKREPIDFDMQAVIKAAAGRGCFLELNAQPDRLDLEDRYCTMARDEGVLVAIGSDSHGTEDFANLAYGIGQARRGWLEAADVLNSRPLPALRELLRKTMR